MGDDEKSGFILHSECYVKGSSKYFPLSFNSTESLTFLEIETQKFEEEKIVNNLIYNKGEIRLYNKNFFISQV